MFYVSEIMLRHTKTVISNGKSQFTASTIQDGAATHIERTCFAVSQTGVNEKQITDTSSATQRSTVTGTTVWGKIGFPPQKQGQGSFYLHFSFIVHCFLIIFFTEINWLTSVFV